MHASQPTLVSESAIDRAARCVESKIGLDFRTGNRRQFRAALNKMAEALGLRDADACATWLLAERWTPALSAMCARFLTVGESYFFREPQAFDLVCEQARAHLAQGEERPLRIWSAGCCTGEEPYSIAITLRERVPQLGSRMLSILATDLNESFIELARAGVYRRWSFRRTEPALMDKHFAALADGRFQIDASLRAQVRFDPLNLAADTYPSATNGTSGIDIIFCRNVLMYLSHHQRHRVVARLRDSLLDGGWLVVNASEASVELFEGFTPVYRADAVFFQKTAMPQITSVSARSAAFRPSTTKYLSSAAAPTSNAIGEGAKRRPASVSRLPSTTIDTAESGDSVMARARVLSEAGAWEEAFKCLRRASEAAPLEARLHESAALFALEHGDQRLAGDSVKRLLYLEPESAIGHYLAALVEDGKGRRVQALRLLNACSDLAARPGHDELRAALDVWLERVK